MYTDDQAQIKQLPLNMRASAITDTCGKPLQVGRYKLVWKQGEVYLDPGTEQMMKGRAEQVYLKVHRPWAWRLTADPLRLSVPVLCCCQVRGDAFVARIYDDEDK